MERCEEIGIAWTLGLEVNSYTMAATAVYHTTIEDLRKELSRDQYSAALLYDELIGSVDQRTYEYKHFFGDILRRHGCVKVLDVACGTGIDSILLLEQGFELVSTDASDNMLDFARKAKLNNEHDERYRAWIIKQANWKTLTDDLGTLLTDTLFDALICLGNSFPHVYDRLEQRECLSNFAKCLKPSGLLLLDHRNYDAIIDGHPAPKYNAYYNYKRKLDTKVSLHYVDEKLELATFDFKFNKPNLVNDSIDFGEFRFCSYPHRLSSLTKTIDQEFKHCVEHRIYGDFKSLGEVPVPGYYLHVVKKLEH